MPGRRLEPRRERVGARSGRRASDDAGGRIQRDARRNRAAGNRPGAGQPTRQRRRVGAARRCSPGTGASPASTRGDRGLRRCPAAASDVLTACATATGVTLSAALKVMASLRSGSKTRSVMRAVSPGASATVRFSRSGFSRSGFANCAAVTKRGIRDVREQYRLRLLQQRAAEDRRRLVDLVGDQLALEAGGSCRFERRA